MPVVGGGRWLDQEALGPGTQLTLMLGNTEQADRVWARSWLIPSKSKTQQPGELLLLW